MGYGKRYPEYCSYQVTGRNQFILMAMMPSVLRV
jgi:hypothetical protein